VVARRLALLAASVLVALTAGCSDDVPALRVVLISLDTLRYDRFSGAHAAMPELARAAAEGAVFSRNYTATSSTQPTHASMLTGLHPWQHGVSRNGLVLAEDALTVTEHLAAAGFSTAAAVSSFPMESRFGLAQGFDTYLDEFTHGRPEKKTWSEHDPDWNRFYSRADTVARDAVALIDAATAQRQFFFFHFFDAHSPYGDSLLGEQIFETRDLTTVAKRSNAELPAILARAQAAYDLDVGFMDRQLGLLLERLARDAGQVETHVIITADHGESFGDDGSFGHGDRVSEPQLHVPLVILSPRMSASVRDDAAGSIDIARTLLSLAGLDPELVSGGRDLSLPPTGAAAPTVGMRRSYAEPAKDVRTTGVTVELVGQRFFLLRDEGLVVGDGSALVYSESSAGPGSSLTPRQADALRRLFASFEAALLNTSADEHLDAETQAALDALGYTR
jgi:arylsulfatase A-like enzyme